ncbi:hypothetical protein [Mycobacterium hubeiense]|uniref:hypothetical protein n=1 Tax=Mycobacterium hubeiense TaxID=1867256 RepID=UPI0018EAB380|nr:hypothetical protein [Mycobacterium sp. QGD 101]
MFSLEVLRARKGDCLLLHYGTADEPALALIDGGPGGVYKPFLRPRLLALRTERGLADDEPLPVDLCMLSHIDDDHVVGLLGLTKELVAAKDDNKPRLVSILDLWHNSFDDIVANDAEELAGAVEARFGPASLTGDLPAGVNVDSVMVLASIPKGRQLRNDAIKLGIERNLETDGELIAASDVSQPMEMGGGLTFTVVGPMLPEIEELQADHAEWVKTHPDEVRASAEGLASYDDESVPNLASIVVLAEADGKSILFTGDARGDKILAGLELVGLVEPGGALHVDVLKCPHHGSINNVDRDFFERITADHYVFSGNGEHGNPDRETLELLADVRDGDDYRIHLTYPAAEMDVERKKHWERHHDEPWSAPSQGLVAFFADHPDLTVDIVEDGVPHIIDLAGQR